MLTGETVRTRGSLKGLLPEELEALIQREGGPRYAARQLVEWLYRNRAESFADMTNLGADLRTRLAREYDIAEGRLESELTGADGTRKQLVSFRDGARAESVIIPERGRTTLCLSTQAGCGRTCAFCATAQVRLRRNLTAGEILEQALIASRSAKLTNVVFMGQGEPFDNYDNIRRAVLLLNSPRGFGLGNRHITVSTAGVVPGILRMAGDGLPAGLTVSLNAPDDALRSRLMPINRTWPLAVLMDACVEYARASRRSPTFAYVLFRGLNDSAAHASRLAALARKVRAKVNLIPCNPARGFERPPEDAVLRFQSALRRGGIGAFYRRERGGDIAAACGQLALREAGGPREGSDA